MLAYDIILELNAPVAQLDRVTGYEPVGRGFESLPAYQKVQSGFVHFGLFIIFRVVGTRTREGVLRTPLQNLTHYCTADFATT